MNSIPSSNDHNLIYSKSIGHQIHSETHKHNLTSEPFITDSEDTNHLSPTLSLNRIDTSLENNSIDEKLSYFNSYSQVDRRDAAEQLEDKDDIIYKSILMEQEKLFKRRIDHALPKYRGYLYPETLVLLDKARNLAKDLKINQDNAEYFRVMYNTEGDIRSMQGQHAKSRRLVYKASKIALKYFPDDPMITLYTNNNRADLFYHIGKLDLAERIMKGSLELLQEKKPIMKSMVYVFLTQVYIKWDKLDKAKEYLEKGIKYTNEYVPGDNNKFYMGRHKKNQALIYFKEGKIEEAKNEYREGIRLLDKTLPKGNFLSAQAKQEYKELFNEEYVGNENFIDSLNSNGL